MVPVAIENIPFIRKPRKMGHFLFRFELLLVPRFFFFFFLNLEFSLSTSFFQSSDLVQLCFSSAHLHPAFGEPCPVCIWKLLSFESPGVWLQCR